LRISSRASSMNGTSSTTSAARLSGSSHGVTSSPRLRSGLVSSDTTMTGVGGFALALGAARAASRSASPAALRTVSATRPKPV
jgi:hypothetical protein